MKKVDPKDLLMQFYLLSRFFVKESKKYGKERAAECTVLALLDKKPMTIYEIADLFSAHHPFMSAAVGKMEKKGLVKKKPSKDRRYRLIALTKEGKKQREENKKIRCKMVDWFFKNWTNKELEQLSELLAKIDLKRPKYTS